MIYKKSFLIAILALITGLSYESSEFKSRAIIVDGGIPFGMTSRESWLGTRDSLDALIEKGLMEELLQSNIKIVNILKLQKLDLLTPSLRKYDEIRTHLTTSLQRLYTLIYKQAKKSPDTIITFGGDHSIAIATISGIVSARSRVGVIWVDAHADINTPLSSSSGNVHGMPVAFLLNMIDCTKMEGWEWLGALHQNIKSQAIKTSSCSTICLPDGLSRDTLKLRGPSILLPEHIVYIGLRDLDPQEYLFLEHLGIKAFFMPEIKSKGIDSVMDETIQYLFENLPHGSQLHLSLDVDGLDPKYFPSTGTPVAGGLSMEDGIVICTRLKETNKLKSVDIVEVNPTIKTDEDIHTTLINVIELVKSIL